MKKYIFSLYLFSSMVLSYTFYKIHARYNVTQNIKHNINHIAFIADGNRRWAKQSHLPPHQGHQEGFIKVAPSLTSHCFNLKIHTVTFWCFSTGNWNRSTEEIYHIMTTFEKMIERLLPIAKNYNAKIVHLGKTDRIPHNLQRKLLFAEHTTQNNSKHIINLGIDYSGRNEICRAIKKLLKNNSLTTELTEKAISKNLDTGGQPFPNPDLVIRTSGEQRLSGFMTWQTLYSELYFTKEFFPDFTEASLLKAIKDYNRRTRTFSK